MINTVIYGDCLDTLRKMDDNSVDLIMGSPPYVDCRTYGIGFNLKGQEYVDWAFERYVECYRVSKGLVAWVIEGKTKKFQYDATPVLLMADLHRAGVKLRKPPIYQRYGIPGSGGPDWWKNNYEWIVCAAKGRLPWSDNTACGAPPKYKPGGELSYRLKDGKRRNEGGRVGGADLYVKGDGNDAPRRQQYIPPKIANPGNVIQETYTAAEVEVMVGGELGSIVDCGSVGGGNIGHELAHANEAPYPEKLVERFILSFCPPGGTVLDPFSGSGTTAAVAKRLGRNYIACDIRDSQVDLTNRRLQTEEVTAA